MSSILSKPRNGYQFNVLGYMRVSKDDELTGSHTFVTQELRIGERMNSLVGKDNYRLELYQDDGVSGSLGLRPTGMQRRTRRTLQVLADKIATKQYDALVIYSQNRLFRNPRGMMEFIEDVLLPHGTALISATEEINISTADGRAMVNLKAVFDGMYRDAVVQRNRDAAATAKQLGYFIGQVPYGWDWQPRDEVRAGERRGIVPIPAQRERIPQMKDWFLSGWSGRRIAGELNNRQVPPPSHEARWQRKADLTQNARWSGSEVVRMLASPTHAGLVESKGAYLEGRHFPHRFWDPEVREQIIALNRTRQERFKTCTVKPDNQQILSGSIICGRCGRRLYTASTNESAKNYRGYVCQNGAQQGQLTCPGMNVRAQWVEDAVVEEIGRLAAEPTMREMLHQAAERLLAEQTAQAPQEREQLAQQIKGFDERFERWADAFSRGHISGEQFAQYNRKLMEEKQAAEARMVEIEAQQFLQKSLQEQTLQVHQALTDIPLAWAHLDQDERRQALLLLLEKLEADREDRLIRLRIKVQLLPEREIVIPYQIYRGKNRSTADPVTLLTRRELSILHYLSQGLSQIEIAEKLELQKNSIWQTTKKIRKKCHKRSLPEIIELARERIQAVLPYLPLEARQAPAAEAQGGGDLPYLSGVLMEVFPLFAKGASVVEVAERLEQPPETVQGRRARILKLMGTSSMLEAVERAQNMGLLKV